MCPDRINVLLPRRPSRQAMRRHRQKQITEGRKKQQNAKCTRIARTHIVYLMSALYKLHARSAKIVAVVPLVQHARSTHATCSPDTGYTRGKPMEENDMAKTCRAHLRAFMKLVIVFVDSERLFNNRKARVITMLSEPNAEGLLVVFFFVVSTTKKNTTSSRSIEFFEPVMIMLQLRVTRNNCVQMY